MKHAKTISIDSPCHQNWDAMTINAQGKFCASCSKTVHDVTGLSKEQLLEKQLRYGEHLCIRLPSEQLASYDQNTTSFSKCMFRWLAVAIALLGVINPFSTKAVAQNSEQPVKEDSLKCENTLRIHGSVKEVVDSVEVPIAFVSIRILADSNLLAGGYTLSGGKFEIEIPRSKLVDLDELTIVMAIPGYSTKRKTLFLEDIDTTAKLQRDGDLSLKPIEIKMKNDLTLLRGVVMGCMATRTESREMITRDINAKTYTAKDLQRYNFFR